MEGCRASLHDVDMQGFSQIGPYKEVGCCVINILGESILERCTYRLSSPLSIMALRSELERFRREKILSLGAVAPQDTPGLQRKWFIQEVSVAVGHGVSPAII